MRKERQLTGLLVLCLLVAGSAQAGLITNGNFDADTVPDGTETPTASNWTLATSAIYNPLSSATLQPYSGDNLLDMANTSGGAGASQAITMVEGQQYKITARVRNYPGKTYVNYFLAIQNTAGTVGYFGVSDFLSGGIWTSGASGNTTTWTLVESALYTATAADATQGRKLVIGTYDGVPGSTGKYACFDNVDVVPEPTTMGLLVAGGTITLLRRKRR